MLPTLHNVAMDVSVHRAEVNVYFTLESIMTTDFLIMARDSQAGRRTLLMLDLVAAVVFDCIIAVRVNLCPWIKIDNPRLSGNKGSGGCWGGMYSLTSW